MPKTGPIYENYRRLFLEVGFSATPQEMEERQEAIVASLKNIEAIWEARIIPRYLGPDLAPPPIGGVWIEEARERTNREAALILACRSALAHAEALRMDTPDEQATVDKLAETLRMALNFAEASR